MKLVVRASAKHLRLCHSFSSTDWRVLPTMLEDEAYNWKRVSLCNRQVVNNGRHIWRFIMYIEWNIPILEGHRKRILPKLLSYWMNNLAIKFMNLGRTWMPFQPLKLLPRDKKWPQLVKSRNVSAIDRRYNKLHYSTLLCDFNYHLETNSSNRSVLSTTWLVLYLSVD